MFRIDTYGKFNYMEYRPDNTLGQKLPLIIFLHGAGERGEDINHVKIHGPLKEAEDLNLQFAIIAPQCPLVDYWSDLSESLYDFIYHFINCGEYDSNRVYLTGLSMGGCAVWHTAIRHVDWFAAVAPICGQGYYWKAKDLLNLPVWAFHGENDGVIYPIESQRMVEAVKRAGGEKIKLTIYPETGHDSWVKAYSDVGLYDWFMQHTRNDN